MPASGSKPSSERSSNACCATAPDHPLPKSEPTAFLRRLFAIIPPPRQHLTRYHGIFSGHHPAQKAHGPATRATATAHLPTSRRRVRCCPCRRGETPKLKPYLIRPITQPSLTKRHRELPSLRRRPTSHPASTPRPRAESELFPGNEATPRASAASGNPNAIAKILTHLGLPTEVPPSAPAHSPPQAEFRLWDSIT